MSSLQQIHNLQDLTDGCPHSISRRHNEQSHSTKHQRLTALLRHCSKIVEVAV